MGKAVNDKLRRIPMTVFRDSSTDSDFYTSYLFQVYNHVRKPVKVNSLIDIIINITDFWFSIAERPKI
jgi:hypothetical protein